MEWERRFRRDILKKAKVLSVADVQEADGLLRGTCDGYQVTIKYTSWEVTSMRCNCAHAKKGGRCVHMAALLAHATQKEEDFFEVLLKERADNRRDDDYVHQVHDKKEILKSMREWRHRPAISEIRHVYLLDYVVRTDVSALVAKRRTIDAFDVLLHVLQDASAYHSLRSHALKTACQAELHQLAKEKKDAYVRLLARMAGEGLALENLQVLMADFKEDRDIKVISDALGERLERTLSGPRPEEAQNLCACALSMMMGHHHMLLDWMDQYGHNPYGRYMFVQLCAKEEEEEAVKILQEALQEDTAYEAFMSYYQEAALALYKASGMTKAYIDVLMDRYVSSGEEEDYLALKKACDHKQWPYIRNQLLHRLTKTQELDLYVREGLYEELRDYVLTSGSLLTLEKYRDVLAAHYPEDVLRRYRTLIWKQAEDAHSESACIELTNILGTMLSLEGGKDYVLEIVKGLQQAYRRNQTMMHVLKLFKQEHGMDKRRKRK